MPGSGCSAVPSGQGTTIYFDGYGVGRLISFDSSHQVGQMTDVTNVGSGVSGSGADTRLFKMYDCTSIEPARLSCTFYGAAPFNEGDLGRVALLEFDSPEESYQAFAMLTEYTHSASAGEFATGSASWQLTAAAGGGGGSGS